MRMQLVCWRTAPLRKSPTGRAASPRSRQGDAALTNAHAHPEDSAPRGRLLKHGIPNSPSDAEAEILFLWQCFGGEAEQLGWAECPTTSRRNWPTPSERCSLPRTTSASGHAVAMDNSAVYEIPDVLAGIPALTSGARARAERKLRGNLRMTEAGRAAPPQRLDNNEVQDNGRVGVIGSCLGGGLALHSRNSRSPGRAFRRR